jgi:hypothetical protein
MKTMPRLAAKLAKAHHNRLALWPLGVYLAVAAFVVPGFRPPATAQAVATGRITGQVLLLVLATACVIRDLLRSRQGPHQPR